jgi:hypothetical protein
MRIMPMPVALLLAFVASCGGGSSSNDLEAGAGADTSAGEPPIADAGALPDMAVSLDAGVTSDTPIASGGDALVDPDARASDGAPPEAGLDAASASPDVATGEVGSGAARKLDLLFMIDDSPSMREEQDNLRRNFPLLIERLKSLPGGLPDLHIGIVSSDVGAGAQPLANVGCPRPGGDRGILQAKPTCGLEAGAKFLSASANGTQVNFQGTIDSAFACLADLGVAGCGYEHQLQSTRVALYESITPENKGFLRSDALLGIVLISDEDDCSAPVNTNLFVNDAAFPMTSGSFRCSQVGHLCGGLAPPIAAFDAPLDSCTANPGGPLVSVSELVASIKALKTRPNQIVVSGIFGWPTNPVGARYRYVSLRDGIDIAAVCQSANGEAASGLRLKQFVESFGAQGSFFSICNDDFSPALQRIGERLAAGL